MALAKLPISGNLAAATVGVSVNFFHDTKSIRVRAKPPGRPRPSTRLQTVRSLQATAYDYWESLSDEERRQWAVITRWRRRHGVGGSFILSPRLEFARRAQVLLDAGRDITTLKPGPDVLPFLTMAAVERLNSAGGCRLTWQTSGGIPAGSLVQFGVSPPAQPGGRLFRTWPVTLKGYAPAAAGAALFTIAPGESRYVAYRAVSRAGYSPRAYRVVAVPPWVTV